jgi:pimeloyl-ACP methyl ester carboxylesterase
MRYLTILFCFVFFNSKQIIYGLFLNRPSSKTPPKKYLLFFNGFLHRSTNYIDLLEKINEENIIVDAPDFTSLSFENEFYKYYNHIDTIRSNIKKYNLTSSDVIFCGHSRGGLIASNLIHNTEFENLVLIAPVDYKKKILIKNINITNILLFGLELDYKTKLFPSYLNYKHFDTNIDETNKSLIIYDNFGHEDITSNSTLFKFICKSNYNKTELDNLISNIVKNISSIK